MQASLRGRIARRDRSAEMAARADAATKLQAGYRGRLTRESIAAEREKQHLTRRRHLGRTKVLQHTNQSAQGIRTHRYACRLGELDVKN